MNELEAKKKAVELMRVEAAKGEMELQIIERLHEIERLKKNIEIQDKRINEIKTTLRGDHG
jgi:hypothetical protein